MTIEDLIAFAKDEISATQNGQMSGRADFPESMKGEWAKQLWHDDTFAYGMEYGYLMGMLRVLDFIDKSK